jgi:hypothetical protein
MESCNMRNEGEVVLIYYQDQPAFFARIEAIEFDVKKDWYRITLLLLTIPSQTVMWILREAYIDGAPFTMNDRLMRMETVEKVSAERDHEGGSEPIRRDEPDKKGRVIPFKKNLK